MAERIQVDGSTITVLGPQRLELWPGGVAWVLRIKSDGTIEVNEHVKPDEAGKQAIEAMRRHLQFIIEAEREACAKIAEDAEINGADTRHEEMVAAGIAAAIRARKDRA